MHFSWGHNPDSVYSWLPRHVFWRKLCSHTAFVHCFSLMRHTRWQGFHSQQSSCSLKTAPRRRYLARALLSDNLLCPALRTCVLASSKGTADAETCREEYVDPNLVINGEVKQQLLNGGIDERLATHFAHLFIRDPLVIYAKDVETFNLKETSHFEGIQSTNWQTVRFKPPPSMDSKNIGWRVEFRPMEVQMTDFENAAFAAFIVLLSRAILHFDLDFYVPIKKVDENMEKAHVRDAVLHEKFRFRKDPLSSPHLARSMIGNSSHESMPNETTSEEVSSARTFSGQISFDWSSNRWSSNRGSSSNSSFIDEPAIS